MARRRQERYHGRMSAFPQDRMSVEDYLAWSEATEGRYELIDGKVVAQAAERAAHAEMKGAIYAAFRDEIRRKKLPCRVLPDGMAVRVGKTTVFEPDVQIYCGPRLGSSALLSEPMVVVEVLSPSTGRNDALRKLGPYFSLASVQHYLIVDPDEPLVVHHARGEGETIVTRIHRDGAMTLEPPGIELALAEIYEAQG
jgi:Uma2 family endonuclease